jgi:hypothetical protein
LPSSVNAASSAPINGQMVGQCVQRKVTM